MSHFTANQKRVYWHFPALLFGLFFALGSPVRAEVISAKFIRPVSQSYQSTSVCKILVKWIAESGRKYSCPYFLNTIEIEQNLNHKNRFQFLKRALDQYNIIWMWEKEQRLIDVIFLGNPSKEENQTIRMVSAPQPSPLPGEGLTENQLRVLIGFSIKKPLPQRILKSPEYKEMLEVAGVYTSQDWLNVRKSLHVKRQVRELIKKQKKRR